MPDKRSLIESSTFSETKSGTTYTEHWRLEDVEASTPSKRYAIARSRLPPRGVFLQVGAALLKLRDVQLKPRNLNTFTATVTYSNVSDGSGGAAPEVGEQPRIEVFGVTVQAQTNVDYTGKLLTIPAPKEYPNAKPQTPLVSYEAAQFGLRIRRKIDFMPDDRARQFTGCVNSGGFRGGGPRTWFCRSLYGTSDDGGSTYTETVELLYNPSGWDILLRWQDSAGNYVGDAAEAKVAKVLPETDFNFI